jgi:hypothetical protein
MRKSIKNTLKKQKIKGGTRKNHGGAVRAIRPDFNNYGDIAKLDFEIPVKGEAGSTHSALKGPLAENRTDFYNFLMMAKKNMIEIFSLTVDLLLMPDPLKSPKMPSRSIY